MDKKKKILIIGHSAKEHALVQKFNEYENVEKIYVAPGNAAMREICECVDIREDDSHKLLEFVLENGVDLTIVSSQKALKSDLADLFQANSQLIFAPTESASNFTISRSVAKKFMYKLRIPTPKFGIFEKPQLAADYVKNAAYPILIGADEDSDTSVKAVCTTVSMAKRCLDDLFLSDEKKVVIEDFLNGHEFTLYVITDGYHALPLAVSADFKFLENGNGGLYTTGIGAFVPDYKVSENVISSIMSDVVFNILQSLQRRQTPYMGILGIECVLTGEDSYLTTGFTPFLKDHDAAAVLNSVGENLLTLFEACAIGSFADDYFSIMTSNLSSVSLVMSSRKDGLLISGLDNLDDNTSVNHFSTAKNEYLEFLTNKGRTLVVTQSSSTLSGAKRNLYENVALIDFENKKFRTDICN